MLGRLAQVALFGLIVAGVIHAVTLGSYFAITLWLWSDQGGAEAKALLRFLPLGVHGIGLTLMLAMLVESMKLGRTVRLITSGTGGVVLGLGLPAAAILAGQVLIGYILYGLALWVVAAIVGGAVFHVGKGSAGLVGPDPGDPHPHTRSG